MFTKLLTPCIDEQTKCQQKRTEKIAANFVVDLEMLRHALAIFMSLYTALSDNHP